MYKEHCSVFSTVILDKNKEIFLLDDFVYCPLNAESLKTNTNSERVLFVKWEIE